MSKLKNGTIVLIAGELRKVTGKPKKTIDGTWLVFHECMVTGKVSSNYLVDIEVVITV